MQVKMYCISKICIFCQILTIFSKNKNANIGFIQRITKVGSKTPHPKQCMYYNYP